MIQAAIDARDKAVEPLRAYLTAYSAAARRCAELHGGLVMKVEDADRELGRLRDQQVVAREASAAPCPIDGNVIAKMAASTPRPAVMSAGMTPAEIAATEETGPQPLSKDDPRYQVHTLGVDPEPPGLPIGGSKPASAATLTKLALERAVR